MSILSLGQIIGGNQRSLYQLGEKTRTAISEISAGSTSKLASGVTSDSTSVSTQRFQSRMENFRAASQEIAKGVSEVAFAAKGAGDIEEQLASLQAELGAAAERPLDEKSLQKINKAIQTIRGKIDFAAEQNKVILPESEDTSNSKAAKQTAENIVLNSKALLGGKASVSTISDIREMISVVQNAAGKVKTLGNELHSTLEDYDVMAAHLEVSMENQLAASSLFPQENEPSLLEVLMGYSEQAAAVQGNRLQPSLMNLI